MNKPSKQKLDSIREDIQNALEKITKKHGIQSIKLGTLSFDADGFKIPVEAVFVGGDSKDMKTLKMNATYLGFNPSIANATITYSKKEFKVVGLKSTKLMIEDSTGTVYLAKYDDVLKVLKAANSEHVSKEKSFTP